MLAQNLIGGLLQWGRVLEVIKVTTVGDLGCSVLQSLESVGRGVELGVGERNVHSLPSTMRLVGWVWSCVVLSSLYM